MKQAGGYPVKVAGEHRFRDGRRAMEVATHGCELTDWKDGNIMDTLAAAYAEALSGNALTAVPAAARLEVLHAKGVMKDNMARELLDFETKVSALEREIAVANAASLSWVAASLRVLSASAKPPLGFCLLPGWKMSVLSA